MKFSTKIFFSIASVGLLSSMTSSYLLYEAVKKNRTTEFFEQYQHRVQLLGESFATIQDSYEVIGQDAVDAVIEWIHTHRRIPSESELNQLKEKIHVSDIHFFNAQSAKTKGNLFERCPSYEKLFKTNSLEEQTPLLRDPETGEVYAHTLRSIPGHPYAVDVGIHFTSATQVLKSVVKVDPEIERIEFFSPSDTKLGSVETPESTVKRNRETTISHRVKASGHECCECALQGFNDQNGFFYRFLVTLSMDRFDEGLNQLRYQFLAVFIFFALLSIALARWLTLYLLKKIKKIQAVVDDITLHQDFSKRIAVLKHENEKDELEALSERFNEMFDTAEKAQKVELENQIAQLKTRIASEVAHDIRSPLTSMTMTLDQMVRTEEAPSSFFGTAVSTLRHGIQRIGSIASKLSRSHGVKSVNESSVVEAPRLTLVDFVISQVIFEQRARLENPDLIRFENKVQVPSAWAVIQLSEIQSAFSNLITNAIEALKPNDSKAQVVIQLNQTPETLSIKISDNGIGMDPSVAARIFEREFTYGKPSGNGLGLHQAKKAIEWSGGTIEVKSTPGQGTEFTIEIPLDEAPAWFSEQIVLSPDQFLIFVDDDPATLSVWKSLSTHLKAKTYFFQSLGEYQAVFGSSLPALAIFVLDQYMGSERGLDFIELNRIQNCYLCTSEFDDTIIQNKAVSLGVHLIPKPCITQVRFEERS